MKFLFVDCCISQRGADSRTRALADAFLTTEFEGGRHQRRVDLITALEAEETK